jgi:hypothetical protein
VGAFMKIIIQFSTLLFIIQLNVSASLFEFTPIKIGFQGVEAKGDTILCYGDYGSTFVSHNGGLDWRQIKVFDKDTIIKVLILEEKIIAFNSNGKIGVSNDAGLHWNEIADLKDSILTAIKYPLGYFIRTRSNLIILDDDFNLKNTFSLISKKLDISIRYQYSSSIAYFNNQLIAETDSANYLVFDLNLNPIKIFDFIKTELCDRCNSHYQIFADSNYFYNLINYTIYRTNDFISFEPVIDGLTYTFKYKLQNRKIYIFKQQNTTYLDGLLLLVNKSNAVDTLCRLTSSKKSGSITLRDFTFEKNRLFITGLGKLIASYDLTVNKQSYISDFSKYSFKELPDRYSDSTYLFYDSRDYTGFVQTQVYISHNNGLTFNPLIDTNSNPELKRYLAFMHRYIDTINKRVFFLGNLPTYPQGGVFISSDNGNKFHYKDLWFFHFSPYFPTNIKFYRSFLPLIQKIDNNYVCANSVIFNKLSFIITYNQDFDEIDRYRDSNIVIDYFDYTDRNHFTISCLDYTDSTRQIKYTSNRGIDWNIIKLFEDTDSLLYYKEINFRSDKYLIIYNFIEKDSLVTIEALDLKRKSVAKIYEYKLPDFSIDTKYSSGIASDAELIYLVVNDTLFYIDDLFDRKTWKYHIFPNNGRVIRTFAKFDDRFYARYRDDVNAENIYWIRITGEPIAPTPIISLSDYDFGVRDVSVAEAISKTLAIENLSDNASLTISAYSGPSQSEFWTDLPQIDSENPIVIAAKGKYDFNVFFKPTSKMIYSDSIIFHSDAIEGDSVLYLRGEGIDTAVSVIEYSVETQPYLWSSPPYPLPSSSEVRSIIYWDTNSNIDDCEVNIYDIFGASVAGKESTTIEKLTPYSGYLSWNCSGLSSGVYIINIIHGTQSIAIKAMVK